MPPLKRPYLSRARRERVALSATYSLAQESRWCVATSAHRKAHSWKATIPAVQSSLGEPSCGIPSSWSVGTCGHAVRTILTPRIRVTCSKLNTRHGLLRLCLQPLQAPVSSTNLNRDHSHCGLERLRRRRPTVR